MTSNTTELLRALSMPPPVPPPLPLHTAEMGVLQSSVNVLVIIRMTPCRLPECSHWRHFSRLIERERELLSPRLLKTCNPECGISINLHSQKDGSTFFYKSAPLKDLGYISMYFFVVLENSSLCLFREHNVVFIKCLFIKNMTDLMLIIAQWIKFYHDHHLTVEGRNLPRITELASKRISI